MSVRVLHIEDDIEFAKRVHVGLQTHSKRDFDLRLVRSVDVALQRLNESVFDVVLADLSFEPRTADASGLELLQQLQAKLQQPRDDGYPQPALMVISPTENAALVRQCFLLGACDVHVKSQLDDAALVKSLETAVSARQSTIQASASQPRQSDACERRRDPRYLFSKSVCVIPIRPDLSPDEALRADGISFDVSASGIGLEIGDLPRLPSRRILVGVEADDGQLHYATVIVRHTRQDAGRLLVGGEFAPPEKELLSAANLVPVLQSGVWQFGTGLPTEILYQWIGAGVLRPVLQDRIFVCPECRCAPTFREGCKVCGSVHTASRQLIHHYACAHVGFVEDFESSGEMICPKCRTRSLVVGADFEFLNGPYVCLDCDWSDTELEVVGRCLRCASGFSLNQAAELELIGYYAQRLDPLALIDAP